MEMLLHSKLKLITPCLILSIKIYVEHMHYNLEKTNIVVFVLFRPWLQSVKNIESHTKILQKL